jgi:tape measure domain-containing protein
MDRLDDFARNSPFAKSTFITAQQQMLAFGIEANKVIPYLDAIQNAVAAAGGSNQQIAELAEIFAKIQGAAKITGGDLNEFGVRGVNAAELIGSQMGKTGAQIREEITAGSLDASAALDALAIGMTESFGGAAAGVKETFDGAFDRIRAAWRDFSSDLATPLVDPNGGGALIDLLNWTADMMRAFLALPEPIQKTALAVTGVTGAVLLLSGTVLTGLPRLAAFNAHLTAMAASSRAGAIAVTGLKIAAGAMVGVLTAAAIGLSIWAAKQAEAKARTAEYIDTLDELGNSTDSTISRINAAISETGRNNWIESLIGGSDTDTLIDRAEKIGLAIEDLQGYILGNAEATERVTKATEDYIGATLPLATSIDKRAKAETFLLNALDQEAKALTNAEKATAQKTRADEDGILVVGESTNALQEQTDALEEQAKAAEQWRERVTGAFQSFIDPSGAFQAAIDKNKEFAEATAAATKKSSDSWEDYYDGQSVTAKQYIRELRRQVEAQEEWAANMTALTERAGADMTGEMRKAANAMIDELLELGPQGAAQVALLRELSDKEFATVVELYARKGDAAGTEFTEGVERHRPDIRVNTGGALQQIRQVQTEISGLRGKTVTVSINTIGPSGNTIERYFPRSGLTQKATGGLVGFADGGRVPGTPPSDPMADNVLARTQHGSMYAIRSGEFIQSQPATDYYGLAAMHAINSRRIPREVLQGFAHGGQIPVTAPAVTASRGAGRPVEVSRSYDVTFVSRGDVSAREVRQGIRAAEALDLPGGEWG